MEAPSLKAVTLTHVRYQRGDRLGHFRAWVSLVPIFISLGDFLAHILFRRELQAIFFRLGFVISQFINELIKTSVQQARPETCESYGWPSSHSQFMFFFVMYFTLLTFKAIGVWDPAKKAFANALHWSLSVFTLMVSMLKLLL